MGALVNKIDSRRFILDFDEYTCYLLGFIWADGYMDSHHGIRLEILSDDMDDIWHVFDNTGNWARYNRHRINRRPISCARICDREVYDFLVKYGYKDKKDPQILSLIPNELKYMWYRGYIDGDGCWYFNPKWSTKQFTIGSEYDNDWYYVESLMNDLGIKYRIDRRINTKGHKSAIIQCLGRDSMVRLGDYLYQDHNHICLHRKRDKFSYIKSIPNGKFGPKSKTILSPSQNPTSKVADALPQLTV